MGKPSQFAPLRADAPEALAQCNKCKATMTIDLVDVLTGLDLVHKDPEDPRYMDNPCGGLFRLFQEVRPNV